MGEAREKLDKDRVYKVSAYNCINCGSALHEFKKSSGLVVSQCNNCGHINKFFRNGSRQ